MTVLKTCHRAARKVNQRERHKLRGRQIETSIEL